MERLWVTLFVALSQIRLYVSVVHFGQHKNWMSRGCFYKQRNGTKVTQKKKVMLYFWPRTAMSSNPRGWHFRDSEDTAGKYIHSFLLCNQCDESWQTDSKFLWRLFMCSAQPLFSACDWLREWVFYWCQTALSEWKSLLQISMVSPWLTTDRGSIRCGGTCQVQLYLHSNRPQTPTSDSLASAGC